MDEKWEDTYLVVAYIDGELTYKTFSSNVEARNFLEDLANDSHGEFEPLIHSIVIKTEAKCFSILTVDMEQTVKVTIGGY